MDFPRLKINIGERYGKASMRNGAVDSGVTLINIRRFQIERGPQQTFAFTRKKVDK